MRPVRIVIFAKAPLPGFAKTRLIPALGAEGSARLARHFLENTIGEALAADIGSVELCVTPAADNQAWRSFQFPEVLHWSWQGEGDLGERLSRAAQRVIAAGESVLLIGTDCPQLDAGLLRWAAKTLSKTDAVVSPTFDGGYALLGLNQYHSSLFENIQWSTGSVASETLAKLKQLCWRFGRSVMLHDIDEPSDLKWVPKKWNLVVTNGQGSSTKEQGVILSTGVACNV